MTEEQIIEKAKKALVEMNLLGETYTDISVSNEIYTELLEIYPEHGVHYTVHFSSPDELASSRGASVSVYVDRKTHKLLIASKKEGFYQIPEHLK